MADTKISAMPAAATLDGTEITPLVQGGINVQTTTTNFVGQTLTVHPATIVMGGTNAATAAGARTNLSAAYSGITLTAGTGLSGGGDLTANRSFAISNTGVTAATYGSATKIPVLAINAQGQVTSASEQTLTPASINTAYGAFHQDGTTTLTANVTNATTALAVNDTTNFPSQGWVIIGNEAIAYTGKTATSFTGLTRADLGTTKANHSIGDLVAEAQGTGSPTTVGVIGFNFTDFSNGVSIDGADNTKVVFATPGLYNIQVSAECLNYTGTIDNITLWFSQGGNAITSSASVAEVPTSHANIPGAVILSLNLFIQIVNPNDYIQVKWTTDTGNGIIGTYPEGTNPAHPSSPGFIFTANQIA